MARLRSKRRGTGICPVLMVLIRAPPGDMPRKKRSQALDLTPCRDDPTRTDDPHVPNVVLYQTEPHLDLLLQ